MKISIQKNNIEKMISYVGYILAIVCIFNIKAYGVPYDRDEFRDGESYEPAQSIDGEYEIGNVEQLYWFAQQVNSGVGVRYNAKLVSDIEVNRLFVSEISAYSMDPERPDIREWIPIGTIDHPYQGNFNGNNKKISGLHSIDVDKQYVGLFGCIGEGGNVHNIVTDTSYFYGLQDDEEEMYDEEEFKVHNSIGAICGLNCGCIKNCINKKVIIKGSYNAGGICGKNRGEITYCSNIDGGVCGNGKGHVGGICGKNKGLIEKTYNDSAMIVTGTDHIGGICGYNDIDGIIKDNFNRGRLDGECDGFIGGICGSSMGQINHCYNEGKLNVWGDSLVGGICGCIYNTVVNIPTIPAGAIVGEVQMGKVEDCSYLETTARLGVGDMEDDDRMAKVVTVVDLAIRYMIDTVCDV